jgi:hypothetical protein
MYRQLYQMGGMGIGSLPTDFGQPLQVSQPMMNPSFGQMQPMMSNPMSNYGQTPLTMMGGGITRLGYQEGSMDPMMEPQMQEQMMQPQMQEQMMQEQMMQPQMQEQMMPQEASGAQPDQAQGENALLTIIQLLIDQGIDPAVAQQLAAQILEVFAQGGEPAVEEFANQLEQEEGMQEPAMMAGGGIMSVRQNYGFGKIAKSIGNAVKSVAKSDIGRAALTIGAVALLGPAGLGLSGAGLGFATAGANLGLQALGGKKLNPFEAAIAGLGAGYSSKALAAKDAGQVSKLAATNDLGYQAGGEFSLSSGVTPGVDAARLSNSFYVPPSAGPVTPPGFVERGITSLKNLGTNPLKTIGNVGTSALDFANKNKAVTLAGATLALSAFSQQPNESDEAYKLRAQNDPRVAEYLNKYTELAKFSPSNFNVVNNPFYPARV